MSIPITNHPLRSDFIQRNHDRLQRISPSEPGPPPRPSGAPSPGAGQPGPSPRAAVISLLLITILTFIPSVAAEPYTEGFEDCDQFDIPDQGACTSDEYSYSTAGTGSGFVSSSQAHTGSKSYRIASTTTTFTGYFITAGTGYIRCDAATSLLSAEWWVYMPDLPDTGAFEFGVSIDVNNDFDSVNNGIWFSVATTGVVSALADHDAGGISGGTMFTAVPDTWYHFEAGCSVSGTAVTLLWREFETESVVQTAGGTTTNWDASPLLSRLVIDMDAHTTASQYFVDDISYLPQQNDARFVFCSQPAAPNFAYDYVEGVVYTDESVINDQPTTFNDAYAFTGESNDFDYLGKQFNPGTTHMAVRFAVEARVDTQASVFITAFTTDEGGMLLEGANGDSGADMTLAGNGLDDGNFEHNVQVQFVESGDHWAITPYYTDGGSQVQMGSSINYGVANNLNVFNLSVDSKATTFILYDGIGTLINSWNLPLGLQDNTFDIQWFIGASTTAFVASTDLDDGVDLNDNNDSTCVWDGVGTAEPIGDSGAAPGSTIPDVDPNAGGDAGDGIGEGTEFLDSPYFWVFVWIVLIVVGIATLSWGTRAGFGGIVYGVGVLCVYIGGVLFYGADDVNPWPIVAVIVFVIAMAIWSRYR